MNRKQTIVAILGTLLIVLSGLFPPWRLTVLDSISQTEIPYGYSLIFAPPALEEEDEPDAVQKNLSVDVQRLVIQWVTLLFTMAVAIYLLADPRPPVDEEEWEEE